MNRRASVLTWTAALVAIAASVVSPGRASPIEPRGGPLHPWMNDWGLSGPVLNDYVEGFGLPYLSVTADHVVIERIELLDPDKVTLVGAQIAFITGPHVPRRPGFYGVPNSFLTVCAGPTFPPPHGLGPSWQAVGLDLLAGDIPALQVYLRADAPGWQSISGVRLHYRDAAGRRWYVDGKARLRMNRVSTPSGGCEAVRGGIWTQGLPYLAYVTDLG